MESLSDTNRRNRQPQSWHRSTGFIGCAVLPFVIITVMIVMTVVVIINVVVAVMSVTVESYAVLVKAAMVVTVMVKAAIVLIENSALSVFIVLVGKTFMSVAVVIASVVISVFVATKIGGMAVVQPTFLSLADSVAFTFCRDSSEYFVPKSHSLLMCFCRYDLC